MKTFIIEVMVAMKPMIKDILAGMMGMKVDRLFFFYGLSIFVGYLKLDIFCIVRIMCFVVSEYFISNVYENNNDFSRCKSYLTQSWGR